MIAGLLLIGAVVFLARLSYAAGRGVGTMSRGEYWVTFGTVILVCGFAAGSGAYWSDARATGNEIGQAAVGVLLAAVMVCGVVSAAAWWTGYLLAGDGRKENLAQPRAPKIVYPTGRKKK